MPTEFSWEEHVTAYKRVWFHRDDGGFVVWRIGVGGNVEVLTVSPLDRRLIGCMLDSVEEYLDLGPEAEVYCLAEPEADVIGFYVGLGFRMAEVPTVGGRVTFWRDYGGLAEEFK